MKTPSSCFSYFSLGMGFEDININTPKDALATKKLISLTKT